MSDFYEEISTAAGESVDLERTIVPSNTMLLRRGLIPENLLMIERGRVEISLLDAPNERLATIAGQGRVLALAAILTGDPEESDVRTLEECEIIRVPKNIFLKALAQNPKMYFAVCKLLSADLVLAERLLREVHTVCHSQRNSAPLCLRTSIARTLYY